MEKNIYHHYFLFFVIFSKGHKQKCLIPTKTCFLDGKKPNIAKLVDIKFWPITRKIYENVLIWVFLHAEFISALKTEPKSIFFQETCKKWKKNIYHHYFLFFVIFSEGLKQKCLIPNKTSFLDGRSQILLNWLISIFWPITSKIARL